MSSSAQISANQANAQKSTGPKTEAGKQTASQNRRSHGLGGKFQVLPCEHQPEYEQLLQELDDEYHPRGASKALLIEQMAESSWTRHRALRLQSTALDPFTGEIADEKKFSLYQRYFIAHNNAFHRALNDLLKQRALKQNLSIGFEREKRQADLHPLRCSIAEQELLQRETATGTMTDERMLQRNAYVDRIWAAAGQLTGQKAA
jgi:hypothetical protein